jgi:uncharacterized protein (DUF58 family)
MIVPRSRLLFWFGVVVLPLTLVAAAEPSAGRAVLACLGGFAALAAVDALGARGSLAGVGVQMPPVVRLSKDRDGRMECRIRNDRRRRKKLRVALAWPPEIEPLRDEMDLALPDGTEWSKFTWTCRPARRGRFFLDAVYVEGRSPLGFWGARRTLPARVEMRVYPNLMAERRNLAALFLRRGAAGLHARRQVGKGREFEKLREYVSGDSFDEIHWKATARRGHPITKVFQIERTQEVYVVIDASRLAARESAASRAQADSKPETALERFVTAALMLGVAAERQGDLFGLLTFTDRVENFVRARNGPAHYRACRDALYTLQPKIVTPDFDEVCSFIRLRMRRRALLFFLTALDDSLLAESFVRNVALIRRQHLVLVNMLQPPGVEPIFSNPEVSTQDDLYRRLGGHLMWQKLRELEAVLQRRGVRFKLLKDERLSAELVTQYLGVKQRQLL